MNRNGYKIGKLYSSIYSNKIYKLINISRCTDIYSDAQCDKCGGFVLIFEDEEDPRCQIGMDLQLNFIQSTKSNARW